jgi:hypothetical protein
MNIIAVGIEFIDMFAKIKSLMSLVYVNFNRVDLDINVGHLI